jgi:hypothetical protein
MPSGITSGKAWTTGVLITLAALVLTLVFSTSMWWTLLVVPVLALLFLVLYLTHRVTFNWRAAKSTKVLIALLFPLAIFVLTGAISWLVGVPQGLKLSLYGEDVTGAIGVPLLFVLVYGLAFVWIVFGTAAATWYAVQQNRLNECWIVCVIALIVAFLSGGIGHLLHASTTQL